MREYSTNGITIALGGSCELVAIHAEGQLCFPQPKRSGWMQEFWKNNYFRKQTKKHLTIKAAEIATRFYGIHQVAAWAKEYIGPYVPDLIRWLHHVDLPRLVFCLDMGFAMGILTAAFFVYLKRRWGRSHEKVKSY